MPDIRCWKCGKEYRVDVCFGGGIVACPHCNVKTRVTKTGVLYYTEPVGVFVSDVTIMELLEPIITDPDVWNKLNDIEQERLTEAAKCYAVGAYTACESMCYDALVSLLRRIYGERRELGYYVQQMENDPDLREVRGAIAYFASKRHEVDHPDRIADKIEAESTLTMTKRLIREIIMKKV